MIKIYPPTKKGSKEMFDNFEKADFERKEKLENITVDVPEKEYEIFLKDRSDRGQDFYGTLKAKSLEEAVDKFSNEIDVDRELLLDNIREVE